MIHDNDALAAHLANEINADLLILMSDVDGVFNKPPGSEDARLLHTFTPKNVQSQQNQEGSIEFGSKSSVGLGGMESKVSSALWALEKGTSVVICNGNQSNAISSIINGKKIGTFFTLKDTSSINVEQLADKGKNYLSKITISGFDLVFSSILPNLRCFYVCLIKIFIFCSYFKKKLARSGSKALQKLEPEERAQLLRNIAESLKLNQVELFKANQIDLEKAKTGSRF